MSELSENPELMLEVLAKLVHRLGDHVEVRQEDYPSGAFNLMSKWDKENGSIQLRLENPTEAGNA